MSCHGPPGRDYIDHAAEDLHAIDIWLKGFVSLVEHGPKIKIVESESNDSSCQDHSFDCGDGDLCEGLRQTAPTTPFLGSLQGSFIVQPIQPCLGISPSARKPFGSIICM